jgi:hypothetical protein
VCFLCLLVALPAIVTTNKGRFWQIKGSCRFRNYCKKILLIGCIAFSIRSSRSEIAFVILFLIRGILVSNEDMIGLDNVVIKRIF